MPLDPGAAGSLQRSQDKAFPLVSCFSRTNTRANANGLVDGHDGTQDKNHLE